MNLTLNNSTSTMIIAPFQFVRLCINLFVWISLKYETLQIVKYVYLFIDSQHISCVAANMCIKLLGTL